MLTNIKGDDILNVLSNAVAQGFLDDWDDDNNKKEFEDLLKLYQKRSKDDKTILPKNDDSICLE
ncbi:MAG: hypothetical protein A2Y24_08305 [Clostridiales bacterium GWE2_32_10]|nr:MAG: hypothetical protein A2Y24_08305 [Clostridiales bacterium GWE2_32_10]HBY21628.1 hypothetical protein [Clostridiales bacterium]